MKRKKELSRIALLAEGRHLSAEGQEAFNEVQPVRDMNAVFRLHNHVANALDQAIAHHAGEVTITFTQWEKTGVVYRAPGGCYYWEACRSRIYPHDAIKVVAKNGEILWLK